MPPRVHSNKFVRFNSFSSASTATSLSSSSSSSSSSSFNLFFFGIAVGIVLGLCLSLVDNNALQDYNNFDGTLQSNGPDAFFTDLPLQLTKQRNDLHGRSADSEAEDGEIPWLCCIVLLAGNSIKPEKQFAAVRDTWANGCNETFYLTNSKALHHRFAEELPVDKQILLINIVPQLADWSVVQHIMQHAAGAEEKKRGETTRKGWTILADGKSYVHTRNLRSLLQTVADEVPLVLGTRQQTKPVVHTFWANLFSSSLLFPSASSTDWPMSASISTDAPLVFSQRAFQLIARSCATNTNANNNRSWLARLFGYTIVPRHTGRALGGCALQLGIALWDPVDEELRPLIVAENLRSLFTMQASNVLSNSNGTMQENNDRKQPPGISQQQQQQFISSRCCSDKAIAFGLLNHKDQWLIDFSVRQLKVFGSARRW